MWPRCGEGSEAGATGRPNLGALQGDLQPLHWTFQQIIGGAGSILGPPNARALGGAGGCRAHGTEGETEAPPRPGQWVEMTREGPVLGACPPSIEGGPCTEKQLLTLG